MLSLQNGILYTAAKMNELQPHATRMNMSNTISNQKKKQIQKTTF